MNPASVFAPTLFALSCSTAQQSLQFAHDRARLLDAIRIVETGGQPQKGRNAVGDHGHALGPYQIHYSYWKDSGVPGRWQNVRNHAYARAVINRYWYRYCPSAMKWADLRTLALVHHYGPSGTRRWADPDCYWSKVNRILKENSR